MVVPVRELHIQNFRGIRDASIELDERVTVFFGSNAAGKTTVLDALAIGLGAITARVPNAKGRDFAKSGDIRRPWRWPRWPEPPTLGAGTPGWFA